MSAAGPGPDPDPRLEDGGEAHPGLRPGPVDLIGIESTRLGLSILGCGLLLVFAGAIPLGSGAPVLGTAALILRLLGWALLALGLALCAPTPNGPLPGWLRPLYVVGGLLGAMRVLYHRFLRQPGLEDWEQGLVAVLWAALLALPWILWRFCQHRGLTGRALIWLWCALALSVLFAINWTTRSSWALWLCPAIGLALYVNSRQTARDLWLAAVHAAGRANRPATARAAEPLRGAGPFAH